MVWCSIHRPPDDAVAPPGPHPTTLPAGLPDGLLGANDAIFGPAYPRDWSEPPIYAVGPRNAVCGAAVGTGFRFWIEGPQGFAFTYEEPWTVAPPMYQGCPYLDSARRAWMAYAWRDGPAAASAACVPEPGSSTTPIPAEGVGLELALVTSGPRSLWVGRVRLHGYRASDAPAGELGSGFVGSCSIAGTDAARCRASLAFLAYLVGGGRLAADAVVARFPGLSGPSG